nr:hypothetical protein [Candidatus Sigynarchaeum springense]
MKHVESGLVFSPREKQGGAYLSCLQKVGTPAELTFGYFKALVEFRHLQKEQVGDITFEDHCIVREVKTRADLASSMAEGRLERQITYMWYLKVAGVVRNFGIIIRDISTPLYGDAEGWYLKATQALEKWQHRYVFSVTSVDTPEQVVEVAKSGMREALWPKEHSLPPILLKKELFEYPPLVIQIAASCHGFAEVRSSELAADYSPAEFWSEAKTDDVNDPEEFKRFFDKFGNRYGIKEKLLREVWLRANEKSTMPEPPEHYFIMLLPEQLMKLSDEVRNR